MEKGQEGMLYKSEYREKTFYFCCESCKKRFDKNPERFTAICCYHDLLQV